jgi:hypothetical protein
VSEFHGTVTNGVVEMDDSTEFLMYVSALEGKRVVLKLTREAKKRTNPENDYYNGVVVRLLSRHTGYTEDEMRDAIKWHFLRSGTEALPTVRGTSELSTIEFEHLMKDIREWAARDLNCYIPEPNERPGRLRVA